MRFPVRFLFSCLSAGILAVVSGCQDGMSPESNASAPSELAYSLSTSVRLEAEKAILSGPLFMNVKTGFTGTGYADYQHDTKDYVQWTVNAAAAGDYTLAFRYANGGSTSRPLSVAVNGTVINAGLAFPPTGSWTTWKTVSLKAALKMGSNAVRTTATVNSGGNLDNLTVTGPLLSANADLANLVPGSGSLSPAFSPSVLSYSVAVPGSNVLFWLTPTAAASTSTIKVNGVAVASGTASKAFPLAVGANLFTVQVTAQNGTSVKTYGVTVTRPLPHHRLAYFVNDVPGGSSIPSGPKTFSASGKAISITRGGVGLYNITFAGLDDGTPVHGAALVTALGNTASYCKSTGVASQDGNLATTVNCFDADGNAIDSRFSFALMMPHAGANAYAEMYIGSSAAYSPFQMFNSTSGAASARKSDRFPATPGMYNATFGGLFAALGGNGSSGVMVSGLDQTTTGCMVGTGGVSVNGDWDGEVYCAPPGFATGTAPGNFTIAVSGPVPPGGDMDLGYAFAFANSADGTPALADFANNSAGGDIIIGHPAVGSYSLTFKGLGAVHPERGGNVQVSRFNFGPVCYVTDWSGSPDLTAHVSCASKGEPADGTFSIWAIK